MQFSTLIVLGSLAAFGFAQNNSVEATAVDHVDNGSDVPKVPVPTEELMHDTPMPTEEATSSGFSTSTTSAEPTSTGAAQGDSLCFAACLSNNVCLQMWPKNCDCLKDSRLECAHNSGMTEVELRNCKSGNIYTEKVPKEVMS